MALFADLAACRAQLQQHAWAGDTWSFRESQLLVSDLRHLCVAFADRTVNKALTKLDLSTQRQLDDDTAVELAQMLAANQSLRSLNVSHCAIGETGAAALARALRGNTTLRELDIRGNVFADEALTHLLHAASENRSLTGLYLPVSTTPNVVALAAETFRVSTLLDYLGPGGPLHRKADGPDPATEAQACCTLA